MRSVLPLGSADRSASGPSRRALERRIEPDASQNPVVGHSSRRSRPGHVGLSIKDYDSRLNISCERKSYGCKRAKAVGGRGCAEGRETGRTDFLLIPGSLLLPRARARGFRLGGQPQRLLRSQVSDGANAAPDLKREHCAVRSPGSDRRGHAPCQPLGSWRSIARPGPRLLPRDVVEVLLGGGERPRRPSVSARGARDYLSFTWP